MMTNGTGRSVGRGIGAACALLAAGALLPSPVAAGSAGTGAYVMQAKKPTAHAKPISSPGLGKTSLPHLFRKGYVYMPPSPARLAELQQLYSLIDQGRAREQAHDYVGAAAAFTAANALEPQDKHALYGLAECAGATGNTQGELGYYRRAIYADDPVPYTPTINEGNVSRLMEFVLLLDKTGQDEEAVSVYNQAAALLDFDSVSGKQAVDVLLPQFGDGPGQVPCTPQGLEAMAHLGISLYTSPFDSKELQVAVALAPDSAAAHYYLGKSLYALGHNADAKAELVQAVQFGDDQTVAAANEILQFLH